MKFIKLHTLSILVVNICIALITQINSHASDLEQSCIAYLAYDGEFWQAWVMSPDGKYNKQLTKTAYEKSRVSWYPSGKSLLVSGNQGGIFKVDLASGKETKINTKLDGMNDAAISADGEYIAFSLSTSGSRDDHNIWIVDADGGNHRKLTNMKRMQHTPVWHPDGKWVYFHSNVDGQSHDIWRVSVDGKNREQLTGGQLYNFSVAVYKDDTVIFSSNRSGNYEIWKQAKGEKPAALTRHPARDNNPSWSPSGKQIAFESSRSGQLNLWLMDNTGNQQKQLTHTTQGARAPTWGPAVKGTNPCQ